METIQPPVSHPVAGVSRKRSTALPASSRKHSELDVLRCLQQSAMLLDHVLDRTKRGGDALPLDEQRALAQNLSIVSNVLSLLGENVIPSLPADGQAEGPLRQPAASEVLARLGRQAAELELCFRVTPAAIN